MLKFDKAICLSINCEDNYWCLLIVNPFFLFCRGFFWSPCLMLIFNSLRRDWWYFIICYITTTSVCIISDKMFFNSSINITFKLCIKIFFLKTLFWSFSSDLFPCQLDFSWVLNLLAAIILFLSFCLYLIL